MGFDGRGVYVVGIIDSHDKQVFVPSCGHCGVLTREVSGKEFFHSFRRDCVFDGLRSNGLDAEVVCTCLVVWCVGLDRGRFGTLFDLVHVS